MEFEKYFGISSRIAKWKEVSDFENRLSVMAGENKDCKNLYCAYYAHIDPEYYEKGKIFAKKLIDESCDDLLSMTFDEIYEDMVYCLHKYGYSFLDYCVYGFVNKSDTERLRYVADKMRYYYCDILNEPGIEQLMTDKYQCYKLYKSYYRRDIVKCTRIYDKKSFIEFCSRHPRFIYKPLCEHSGHGIEIIDSHKKDIGDWFDKVVVNSPGIAEELIVQGEAMNSLNASAVNTCRVMTFTINSNVYIIGTVLRIAVGNAITDNAGAGGIYAAVDYETGKLKSDGTNFKKQIFAFHPDTHIQLCGFQLPEWEKAKSLINSMALHHKGATLISWDIAYSINGWCMVEANDNGGWRIMQSHNNGLKSRLFELMDKYFA